MTDNPEHQRPWAKIFADVGEVFQDAGNAAVAQVALAHLMKGERTKAAEMLDTLPDKALQPAMDAATQLAGLLLLKGRARGLSLQDPTERHGLRQDPPPPA